MLMVVSHINTMELQRNQDDDAESTLEQGLMADGKIKDPAEVESRGKWSKQSDFLLACIGMAVGLGNIWRFPYLCYKNGGGAFLIPYMTFLVLGGIPLFMLEIALGQYMSLSGLRAWNICPLFQGIGISNMVTCFFMNIYYIIILAWSAYYFTISMTSVLPWSHCNNPWNTPRCSLESVLSNGTNDTSVDDTGVFNVTRERSVDPSVEFWERKVLQLSSGITDGGGIIWELALSLLVMWVLIYFCLWKGVKWTGKIVYFTATFPYLILFVLLGRGLTLDGAMDGIVYYVKPDLSRLADVQVWMDGGTQIFFSYAVAIGAMITLGSYNTFSNNFYKDCMIIASVNSGTSIVGGFTVFSVLGFMAKQQNVPIADVADAGPGLAFITYPKAVTQMPLSPLWAALFFFMIILLGLDSQFVGAESVITPIVDYFPKQLQRKNRRMLFVAVYCLVSYLAGYSMISRGGMYIFQLFDYYSASGMVLLWTATWETVAIAWVFGADRFYDGIELMIGARISPYLRICWKYITPTISMGLFMAQVIRFEPLTYNKTYVFPGWAQAFGMMLAVSAMICLPICGVVQITLASGTLKERWKKITTPVLRKHQIHPNWAFGDQKVTLQVNGVL